MMKKIFVALIFLSVFSTGIVKAQSYNSLWNKVEDAERQDLPQTERKVLGQLIAKAEREAQYGHLLKALLKDGQVAVAVSPDSLTPFVERLQQREQKAKTIPLQAVYQAVLGHIYTTQPTLGDNRKNIGRSYQQKAMSHPKELAAVKAADYQPLLVKGSDGFYYGDNLLSAIAYETGQFKSLHAYYLTTPNRVAQLLSGIEWLKAETDRPIIYEEEVLRFDSLMVHYADLPECGEAAIARYMKSEEMIGGIPEKQKIDYIDEALKRWGTWKRMDVLRNEKALLTMPFFHIAFDELLIIPCQEKKIDLSLRNLHSLTMKVYRVNVSGDTSLDPSNKKDYEQLKKLLTPMPEATITKQFLPYLPYEKFKDSMFVKGLPAGVYMLEFSSQPQTETIRTLLFVSDVRLLQYDLPRDKKRFVVVDATTGQPMKDASIRLSVRKNGRNDKKETVTLATDKEGECIFDCGKDVVTSVYAFTNTDAYCPSTESRRTYHYYNNNRNLNRVSVFTDRAIYRPGQKVQVAAILYTTRHGIEHESQTGKKVEVNLRDANYKEVAHCELTTDEYGLVNTEFLLPSKGLSGRYSVTVDGQTHYFSVEEYKRPTFQVEFPKIEQDYRNGDTLTVRASAMSYAGVPVQGARVKYTVERRVAWWWFNYYRYWEQAGIGVGSDSEQLFQGETTTDQNGHFEVSMPMVMPKGASPQFYNFVVTADVTDAAGESHQGELSLPLGNRQTVLTVDLEEKILIEKSEPMKFHWLNAAGNDVNAVVCYQLDGGKWKDIQSNTSVALPQLKSGRHELLAVCGTDSLKRSFVVFSLDDTRPAVETDNWFFLSANQFANDTDPVTLQVGSSDDIHIVYTILAGDTIIEQGSVNRSGELLNRKFVYKEEYGNGLTLSFAWIRNGKTYTFSDEIRRPVPNKNLLLKWETFRDRLIPGQQEEWTLTILSPTGGKMEGASLMATLYDKSLDQLMGHQWKFEPQVWLPLAYSSWISGQRYGFYKFASRRLDLKDVEPLKFWQFDADVFPNVRSNGRMRLRGTKPMMMNARSKASDEAETYDMLEEVAITGFGGKNTDELASSDAPIGYYNVQENLNTSKKGTQQLRQNLQETAFFFPSLISDADGRVSLKFTLPESLTTWRFMGLAHTKDMMYGMLDGETVAKKDVMILPNVPRFLRQGDEAVLTARVFNTSDEVIEGTVRLELLDAERNFVVFSKQVNCLLEANNTVAVSIPVESDVLNDHTLLICKMMVTGEDFSDGEQHYLPVLPNREQVTVTVPFVQTEPSTKTITLPVVPQQENGKLTVEYTNNPAWLMIQSLPSLAHPHDNCAICQAASLYTNGLGRYIIDQNPSIKSVFDTWMNEEQHSRRKNTSLYSSLEKNDELKDLLLSETPWVADADRERDQKQRLVDFFDETVMNDRLESAVKQLKALQNADGSWSWWNGMEGSYYMTVEVSQMLVRLQQMTASQNTSDYREDVALMLSKAFNYMDGKVYEMVKQMKEDEKKGHKQAFPSHKALQYLYIYAIDGRKPSANMTSSHSYLKNLLKKEGRNLTIYDKAMASIILQSPMFLKSLHEWSSYKEDVGRYYDTPRALYSWRDYRIPTQVAVIEAFKRLLPSDTKSIRQLQQWLLHEKRAQAWDTPINTVEAIYAFFDGQQEVLDSQPQSVLKIDGKPLVGNRSSQSSSSIGYVKSSVPVAAEAEAPQELTVEKTSSVTSWGAVYMQYMQDVKDIDAQGSELSVNRQLLVEKDGRFVPLEGREAVLRVGSRIRVRLTIDAKRDLDFVELIDKRAACLEPLNQLSGYHHGAYVSPKDHSTQYFFNVMAKGRRVVETEYYVDRVGRYETGVCTVQCAYAPEYRATTHSMTLIVTE